MTLLGANRRARPVLAEKLPGRVSYFRGSDPRRWHTGIPTYARVRYRDVYPGIDLIYHGRGRQLEYDFAAAPGADLAAIHLSFQGARNLQVDRRGDLVMETAAGPIREHRPVIFQEIGGARKRIPGGYILGKRYTVAFQVGRYDRSRPLVIDPVLSYATYLGGSGQDDGKAIAVDAEGNAYVTGQTFSLDLPTGPSFAPKPSPSPYGGYEEDAFVVKLDPTGTRILYAAYLGGAGFESGNAIAVDRDGNAYVTGKTSSYHQDPVIAYGDQISPLLEGFPTTANAFDPIGHTSEAYLSVYDAFVSKISPDGSTLLYSSYLGQQGDDEGRGIAADARGDAWVVGATSSDKSDLPYLEWYREFPTTPDAIQPHYGGGDHDAFLAEIDTNASGAASLVYSTYLGGRKEDKANSLALDGDGALYVTGFTSSPDFPVTPGAYQTENHPDAAPPVSTGDVFVTKLDPTGRRIIYSTLLGGSLADDADSIAVDRSGAAHVTGWTFSNERVGNPTDPVAIPFPTTPGAFQTLKGRDLQGCSYNLEGYVFALGPCGDAFIAKLDPSGGHLVYSTYLGGSSGDEGEAVAVDAAGNAWVGARSSSNDLPAPPKDAGSSSGTGSSVLMELDPSGHVVLMTRLGPAISGLALDPSGGLYVAGSAGTGLSVTPGAAQATYAGAGDAFVAKFAGLAAAPSPVGAKGDLNGDGKVNVQDATLLLQLAVGLRSPTPEQQTSGDLNGDGKINVQDATLLLRRAVGL